MRTVGVKTLKNKLSEYLRLVQRGERVLISDRDRVVAELVPPDQSRSPLVADAVLAEMVRSGVLLPALRPPGPPPSAPPVARWSELQEELALGRSER
jgi:prevent-host-death family protein